MKKKYNILNVHRFRKQLQPIIKELKDLLLEIRRFLVDLIILWFYYYSAIDILKIKKIRENALKMRRYKIKLSKILTIKIKKEKEKTKITKIN